MITTNIQNKMTDTDSLRMRQWIDAGKTKSLSFRLDQLHALKKVILKYEEAINQALYADLRKSPEEVWASELGLLFNEINAAIQNLKSWMRPKRTSTNWLNWPSVSQIRPEPKGIVLIISPWNYPLQLLLKPLVGAIAAGNVVVLKASEHAPATAKVIGQIIQETFDPDYIRFMDGDGAVVIPALMKQVVFDYVFFTGSTQVGRKIYQLAAEQLIPVTLELGGKSPCVVERDANLTVSARRIASIKFSNCGQMCVAPDYLLVHESVKDKFMVMLKETIRQFYSDSPDEVSHYGKIIHAGHFDRLMGLIDQTVCHVIGKHDRSRLHFAPTLVENISLSHPVMQEEIFGPILPVFSFNTQEEALEIIRRNRNPLAFYVFTEDAQNGYDWIDKVPSGGACINQTAMHLTNPHLPFGGRGQSGIGAYQAEETFNTFSHFKSVMRTPTWFDPMLKYPPFLGKLKLLKKII